MAKPVIICRMKCKIMQLEKSHRREDLPVSQGSGHSRGCDSGGLVFVSSIACLDIWENYVGNPGSGGLESRMGFYFICFVISFVFLSSQTFNNSMQNYLKGL